MVPGATASLTIESGANSICSLTAVDKATTFLPNHKPINDVPSILKSFHSQEKELAPSARKSCVAPSRRPVAGGIDSEYVIKLYHNGQKFSKCAEIFIHIIIASERF